MVEGKLMVDHVRTCLSIPSRHVESNVVGMTSFQSNLNQDALSKEDFAGNIVLADDRRQERNYAEYPVRKKNIH